MFDSHLDRIFQYIEEKKSERLVREFLITPDQNLLNGFLSDGEGLGYGSNIVLKSDTLLELGGPSTGSYAVILYTDSPELIRDGRITVIGPDVGESTQKQLPFAQVIMAGGNDLNDNDYLQLHQLQNICGGIDGYMIKSTLENIWSRISHKAAQKGFNLKVLGAAMMNGIKSEMPRVQSVEILFVTSGREDVNELDSINKPVKEAYKTIRERIWSDRGVDILACNPGGHCGTCDDQTVCKEIRKIAAEHREKI